MARYPAGPSRTLIYKHYVTTLQSMAPWDREFLFLWFVDIE